MSSYAIHALPAGEVETGAPTAVLRPADDRSPCRRCLRDAEPGELLVLAPYDPFTRRSPYAGQGPVFVRAVGRYPLAGGETEQVAGRILSIRAYDADAMLTDATVLP